MPRGDGTGPPRGGRGMGGDIIGRRGGGSGRMRGIDPGIGPSGDCICPNCQAKISHQAGLPCSNLNCPKCGTKMVRQ